MYSETSLNRTLRKPALREYRPIFLVPAEQFIENKVPQTGHLSTPAKYILVPVLAGLEKFHCKYD
jgi:hypothetical protein